MDKNWTEALTDEQKEEVWKFIVFTVKEIREQIALDIMATAELWKQNGYVKSRRTARAFQACAAVARGENEIPRPEPEEFVSTAQLDMLDRFHR